MALQAISVPVCIALPLPTKRSRLMIRNNKRVVRANYSEYESGMGKPSIVDENMIVLRRRITEVRMKNYTEDDLFYQREWMEWEKKFYLVYHAKVCKAVGALQIHLLNSRPQNTIGTMGMAASMLMLFLAIVSRLGH